MFCREVLAGDWAYIGEAASGARYTRRYRTSAPG
jgi:hypothetical protein